MKIRFGTFDAALGRKAARGGFTFFACAGAGDGTAFEGEHRLEHHVDVKRAPRALRKVLAAGSDAAWVRARLPRVFDYAVSDPEMEKTLFCETFVAVRGEDAVVFTCADYYGRTGLSFAPKLDAETKTAITKAFFDLLLEAPDDLADYALRTYHLGAGVWLNYACEDGEISVSEEPE
jgi:hypothetical protein